MSGGRTKEMWDFYETGKVHLFEENRDRARIVASEVFRRTPVGGAVLEIGVGNGDLIRMLKNSRKMSGLDISEKNIEKLRGMKEFDGIELLAGDIATLPAGIKDLDAVITSDVIEHLDDATLGMAVKEMHRVLKKGGRWFITVPDSEILSENEVFCIHCGKSFHRFGHMQSFDEARLDRILSAASFVRVSARKIYPLKQNLPVPLLLAYRVFARIYFRKSASILYVAEKK